MMLNTCPKSCHAFKHTTIKPWDDVLKNTPNQVSCNQTDCPYQLERTLQASKLKDYLSRMWFTMRWKYDAELPHSIPFFITLVLVVLTTVLLIASALPWLHVIYREIRIGIAFASLGAMISMIVSLWKEV
jgi:hypothetical protein